MIWNAADLTLVESTVRDLLDPLRQNQPPVRAEVMAEAMRQGGRLRHRRRSKLLAVPALAAALIIVLVLVIQAAVPRHERGVPATLTGTGWHRAAETPLSVRSDAFMVNVGTSVFLIGGFVNSEPTGDGAAYDIRHNTWHRIAPSPRSLTPGSAVATADTIYVLRNQMANPVRRGNGWATDACWRVGDHWNNPGCEQQVMVYSITANRWTQLPTPPRGLDRLAVASDGRLIAYRKQQKSVTGHDYLYNQASRTWVPLPSDGLGVTTDRTIVSTSSGIVVIAAEPADSSGYGAWAGAVLRTGGTAWERLPPSGAVLNMRAPLEPGTASVNGSDPGPRWAYVGGVLVNPSAQTASGHPTGRILDPRTWTWSGLPVPDRPDASGQPVLRATGDGRAIYGQQLFDAATRTWRPIPSGPGTFPTEGQSAAIISDRLLVFGGEHMHDVKGGRQGIGLKDLWILRIPAQS